jgi:hypothetical protein
VLVLVLRVGAATLSHYWLGAFHRFALHERANVTRYVIAPCGA